MRGPPWTHDVRSANLTRTTDNSVIAKCPRCGYDLRGQVQTWSDACPLEGTCTECGLLYPWSEVLRPDKFEPPWCIEFEPQPRRFFWASIRTYLRSYVPWRFWSRIQMSHRVRKRRLALYMAVLFLPLLIVYVGLQSTVALYVRGLVQDGLDAEVAQYATGLAFYQGLNVPGSQIERQLAGLPASMRQENRDYYNQNASRLIAELQQLLAGPPAIVNHPPLSAVLEAVFQPFSRKSSGTTSSAYWNWYPSPSELYSYLGRSGTAASIGRLPESGGIALLLYAGSFVGLLGLPISMLLLPMSRRRAKVRWSHILRVFAYSTFIPTTVLVVGVVVFCVGWMVTPLTGPMGTALPWLTGAVPWLALVTWWAVAIKRYLKMPHGLAIAILMSIVSVLCAAVATYFLQEISSPY